VTGTTVSLTKNTYEYNYGKAGGIIAIYDLFDLTISDDIFRYNSAYNGGILYVSQLAAVSDNSSITVQQSTFYNNSATY
jgi:hypothetical protein